MSNRKAPPRSTALPPPPAPPPTAENLAAKADISRRLQELLDIVTEKNLLRVQRLVDMALRGQVPPELVQHFSIIGRNYYELADNGPSKPSFRVIEGGAS